MSIRTIARLKAPIALLTQIAFLFGTFPARLARAEEHADAPAPALSSPAASPASTVDAVPAATTHAAPVGSALRPQGGAPSPMTTQDPAQDPVETTSLATGGDKTGVSSQAISIPQGTGKIQGMGESFSTQMSTGVATFSVPFALPDARGAVQPSLSLSYSSGGGHGLAGVGWDVGVPFIARQTDRGLPKYDDRQAWHANQDRFVFNGGQELVPICLVSGGDCSNKLQGEVMPSWGDGWQYFRARVEGSYLRFFWSPDHKTWRVQSKSGEEMELGVPLDAPNETNGLESDPSNTTKIFRWNLARQYDAQRDGSGLPANIVAYRYFPFQGMAYLTDIYDTPPATGAATAQVSTYAHHTRVVYEPRPDTTFSFRRGWRVDQTQRLARVDVTSKVWKGQSAPRHQVRRYHLSYDGNYHISLLTSVQLEGRCSGDEASAPAEGNTGELPQTTGCDRLPPMTFDYQHVAPFKTDGTQGARDLAGYEGFDERIIPMAQSPNYSIDEEMTDLFDINSDGLPDVLVTAPGYFGGKHGAFFNGAGGRKDSFGASTIGVLGVLGADASVITLKNLNVQASDLDGDGTIDLLHMPRVRTYSVYTPKFNGLDWNWQGRVINTADHQDPRIDFGNDTPDIHVLDANGDGLVDLVRLTGTEMQTFFALGRYPSGDAQYGSATWASAMSSTISNLPVSMCVPWAGTPARFSDSDIKLGDMNGDGLADIVRIHQGDIRYWPGRGNGLWGTGGLNDCAAGTFGQGRDMAMADSPWYSDPNGSGLRLDDVNGDGLDDLVQVRFADVDVWLNVDGAGWTHSRHLISGTPPAPNYTNRVRLVDVNGSGTRDILWGDGGRYKYIDLAGGQRPWVLTHVANGLGKTTDFEYSTSTALMLAAEAAGKGWTSKAPMPLHVVTRVTEKDNLAIVGRPAGAYVTEYTYENPVYDGRQREFRGFRNARAKRIGDSNSPTVTTASTFLLGECVEDDAYPPPAPLTRRCTPEARWVDNPREPLKGLPVSSEAYDDNGGYVSTVHHTYRLRKLYSGLDGRDVRVAFESASENWAYDTAPFSPSPSPSGAKDVDIEDALGMVRDDAQLALYVGATLRASNGRAHTRSETSVDPFGNATTQTARGCMDGCPEVDEVITTTTSPQRITQVPEGGWLWRTVQTSVRGANDRAPRNVTITTYDTKGNPTETKAVLAGTLSLDRFHETSGRAIARTPAPASADGTITISNQTYDALGNRTLQTTPNARCRSVGYTDDYADLPSSETVFAGFASGSCGGLMLTATAVFDRGLGTLTKVIDLHGEPTEVGYDGFGRLASLKKPSPTDHTQTSLVPSVVIDYEIANNAHPYWSIVHTKTQDGLTDADNSYREAYAYSDGFGRAIVTLDQADKSAGDGGDWIVNGLAEYDNKGAARRTFLAWFWDGNPRQFDLGSPPRTLYRRQRYDAFGREVQTFGLDGIVTLQSAYHALGVDKWDAADLQPGPRQGTYASARQDGHGRAVSTTERIHVGGGIEQRETRTRYLSTGEPTVIERRRGNDRVVRWLRYDSLGRMVLNVDPNTSAGFVSADPGTLPPGLHAWRYAYNDNGDLIGTSDARGCGNNYHYDAAGRLLVEDYSPCVEAHALYSEPDLSPSSIGYGAEVFNRYDSADPDRPPNADFPVNTGLYFGRLASVSDRASKTLTRFDGRGRVTGVARRIAKPLPPGTAEDNPANRYTPQWYEQTAQFDGADRPVIQSTGAESPMPDHVTPPPLLGATGQSFVTTDYSKRGSVRTVGSSYSSDPLVVSVTRDADGLMNEIVYGDLARTTTAMSYDLRRRLSSVQTYRGPPPIWSQPPQGYTAPTQNETAQRLLTDLDYSYDVVDNPIEIRDWRDPGEWPVGAKPVTRKMQYDDLYRLTRIDYSYAAGDDTWVSPFAAENSGQSELQDPRRAKPSPHLSFAKRVLSQSFQYDWLGNTTNTDDDAKGFYDRSLGAISNGTAGAGPYQLKGASGGANPRDGALITRYDDAGNLVGLVVVRNAMAPCLGGSSCSQRFVYEWDEVGRLTRARRWDGSNGTTLDPPPSSPAAVDLLHAYDASDSRVLKTAVDPEGSQLHTVYIFESLELCRRALRSA